MEGGFRKGNFYGSYYGTENHNALGLMIGLYDIPSVDEGLTAHTFSLVIYISHFTLAIGYIIREY